MRRYSSSDALESDDATAQTRQKFPPLKILRTGAGTRGYLKAVDVEFKHLGQRRTGTIDFAP